MGETLSTKSPKPHTLRGLKQSHVHSTHPASNGCFHYQNFALCNMFSCPEQKHPPQKGWPRRTAFWQHSSLSLLFHNQRALSAFLFFHPRDAFWAQMLFLNLFHADPSREHNGPRAGRRPALLVNSALCPERGSWDPGISGKLFRALHPEAPNRTGSQATAACH